MESGIQHSVSWSQSAMSAPANSPPTMPALSTSAALWQVFNSPPIYDTLFAHCMGTTSPARLSRVHPGVRLSFQDYTTRSWHKRLLRYFPDPRAFRSFQARTGFLVSGSQPLQLFMGDDYGTTSDIDLYPWPGTERVVGDWIIAQGYRYVDDDTRLNRSFNTVMDLVAQEGWDDPWAPAGVHDDYRECTEVTGVLRFVKDVVGPGGEHFVLQVQVVASRVSPVVTILDFHSSLVTNILSWSRAYSLFPRTTCDQRRMVILREYENMDQYITEKYNERGFSETWRTFPADAPAALAEVNGKYEMHRWIGDQFTWTIDLRTDGVNPPPQPEVDITLNGFSVVLYTHDGRSGDVWSDSDSDCGMSVDSEGGLPTVVTIVHGTTESQLTVPYTLPDGFTEKIQALKRESELFLPSQYHLFFDPVDNVGRDGLLRQAKCAYERERNGALGLRLFPHLALRR